MAQFGLIYRLQWNTVPSVMSSSLTIPAQEMIVNIYDTSLLIEDFEIPNVIDLQADANPLVIKIINNDEDKFSPIRAKQAIIQFKSDSNQFEDTLTFADSNDNRWKVIITADGETIFIGYLMITDIQQDHLPDPNTVVLTASDHLALLKDVALTTDSGENPTGKYRIAELIALCLKKTGLGLQIVVVNNLRHGGAISPAEVLFLTDAGQPKLRIDDTYTVFFYVGQVINVTGTVSNNTTFHVTEVVINGTDVEAFVAEAIPSGESSLTATLTDESNGHIYDKVYLDALTFEEEIGTSEDCNTVLEKILGEDCFLTQWKGAWYIMRIDEYDGNPIYECVFTANGALVGFNSPTTYLKNLGASETRRLANADALRRYESPYGGVREIFDFAYPEEIPCNVDFVRSEEASADPDIQRTGYTAYELECWDPWRLWGTLRTAVSWKAAILRKFNTFDDEIERFIMLTMPVSATGAFEYIRSQAIPVHSFDKFTWRFDARAMQDTAGDGSILVCMIILYGIDGTVWVLRNSNILANWNQDSTDVNTSWKLSNTDVTLFRDGMQWGIYDDGDHPVKTEWVSFTMDGAPVPVEGNVYIHLFSANQQAGAYDDFDINYQNLTFEYYPYIGGTYKKYIKFHNKVTRDPVGYFNFKREKTVYIADSPKPLFKGSMFIAVGRTVLFTGTLTFASPNSISTPLASGNLTYLFTIGQQIVVTGTNAGIFTIVNVIYHSVPNNTEIIVSSTISTVTETATIYEVAFILTSRWYDSHLFALGAPPDPTYFHSYGYIQAYSVWNQFKLGNRILQSSALGLGSMWPDALDKWQITDNNPHVNNRYFMLISFEQNWKTALWSGIFIEDYRTDIDKDYTSPHEFRYLTK